MASTSRPLFSGSIANGATQYVGIPISKLGALGAHIAWKDATSSATITLELTSYDDTDAPTESAGSAWHWLGSGISITGPAASAAGGATVHAENVRARRARLKIVAAANCSMDIFAGALE